MSSFLLKKKHMREALLFCFNLKKSAAESHRMWRPIATMLYWKQRAEIGFRFNDDNFYLSDKKRENRPRKIEDSIAGSFGRGRYPIAKNACRAIGCFSSSHFHAMGKVQKIGKWVLHELNNRQMDTKTHAKSAYQAKKKVVPASDCDRR